MTQCDSYMLTGGRCDLDKGHDRAVGEDGSRSRHQKAYETYVATWTDESLAREVDRQASRFD